MFRAATAADAAGVAEVYLASRKAFLPFAPLAHADADVRRWVADVLIPAGGVTVLVLHQRRQLARQDVVVVEFLDQPLRVPHRPGPQDNRVFDVAH